MRLLTPRRFLGTYQRVRNSSKWVSVQRLGGVRAHACLGSPISDIPFGHLGVIESMEMVNVAPGKRTLINWERHNWIEYASFGVGQVGEDRGHRLDIDFVNSGSRTILNRQN